MDELLINHVPVLLGGGTRLYDVPVAELEPVRYRVVR